MMCVAAVTHVTAADIYRLVDDASTLAAGDKLIIAATQTSGSTALGTTQNSNNRAAVAVTIAENAITDPGADIEIVTLEKSGLADYPWKLKVADGYLYSASSSKNYLRTNASIPTNPEGYYADITIAGGVTKIAMNRGTYQIQKNKQDPTFSCYKGTQDNVQLYRLDENPSSVATPVIEMVEQGEGFAVTMSCSTEGAEIHYTTDETVPTAESATYTAPLECWEVTTYKAVAVKDGEVSSVATFTANPPYILDGFANLYDFMEGMVANQKVPVIVKSDITTLRQVGDYLFVRAGSGFMASYMLVYGKTGKTLNSGDTFNRLEGNFTVYFDQPEITEPAIVGDVTPGTAVEPELLYDLTEVSRMNLNHYVKVQNVAITGVSGRNATITDLDGNECALYNRFEIELDNAAKCDIIGFVTINNGKMQIWPAEIAVSPDAVEAPAIEMVEQGEGFAIAMTCATEGAEIRYTTDGTVPTAESTLYTAPVECWEVTTFKAVAVKDGQLSVVTTFEANPPYVLDGFANLYDFMEMLEPEQSVPVVVKSQIKAIYQNGSYLFATAGSGYMASYMMLYGNTGKTFSNGDTFDRVEGNFKLDYGQPQIAEALIIGEVTPGEAVEPTLLNDLTEVAQYNLNHYVVIENVAISAVSQKYGELTDADGNKCIVFNKFALDMKDADGCAITGFVTRSDDTMQIWPIEITYPAEKPSPGLAWIDENGDTVTEVVYVIDGDAAQQWLPEPSGMLEGELTLTSSNPEVAAINDYMGFDVLATGETTITLSVAETEMYAAESASFLLKVITKADAANITSTIDFSAETNNVQFKAAAKEATFESTDGQFLFKATAAVGEGGNTYPTVNKGQLRFYGSSANTLTIAAPTGYKFKEVSFNFDPNGQSWLPTVNGIGCEAKAATSRAAAVDCGATLPTAADEVVIGCGGTSKSIYLNTITFVLTEAASGIESVEAEGADSEAEYYNLQGVRVTNPAAGLYIRRQGGKATKVVIR